MELPIRLDNQKVNKDKLNELIFNLGLSDKRKNLPNELSRRTTTKSSYRKKFITGAQNTISRRTNRELRQPKFKGNNRIIKKIK